MAENSEVKMQATLGLTGLTMNAMALIAPGAGQYEGVPRYQSKPDRNFRIARGPGGTITDCGGD